MCDHKFKLNRQSSTLIDGINVSLNVYECIFCGGIKIYEVDSGKEITLNGRLGEEV